LKIITFVLDKKIIFNYFYLPFYASIDNRVNSYSYRNYRSNIYWNKNRNKSNIYFGLTTIYKFDTKLSKYEIIYNFYNLLIENYLKIMKNEIDTLYTHFYENYQKFHKKYYFTILIL